MQIPMPGYRKDTLVRRLALAKLRELRRAGMSYREIAKRFALSAAAAELAAGSFAFRLPPERLLAPDRASDPAVQEDHAAFLRALDALEQGLAIFDLSGAPLHLNRPLRRLLDDDSAGARLQQELNAFARSMWDLVRVRGLVCDGSVVEELEVRPVPLENDPYHLRGSYLGLDLFGRGGSVLVTVHRPGPLPLSEGALRERFGLSRQQYRVALLLVEGVSNTEIAEKLCISPHTARRHTEHILHKLGVRSRAECAARILLSER